MTTTNAYSRQPTKQDYADPTKFKFSIVKLPKVEYFCTQVNLPGISISDNYSQPTPFRDIPLPGEKLRYEPLAVTFIVDENLENYIEMHTWLTSIGFPKDRSQFKKFRSTTANTPVTTQGTSSDIGDVKPATAERSMFSDATLTVLTNKNNPIAEVRFADCFPTSISSLEYNQNVTDVDYLTADITFKYKIYEIHSL